MNRNVTNETLHAYPKQYVVAVIEPDERPATVGDPTQQCR